MPYPWQTFPLQHEPSLEMAIVNERTHSQLLQDKSQPHQCLTEADANGIKKISLNVLETN
ncbi:hypothetical protein [Bacillus subtilis]|uniref:hypothetical protein n=1 Tax=Bacillus subtilis TaxID=1423 RepID=UPI003AEF4D3D